MIPKEEEALFDAAIDWDIVSKFLLLETKMRSFVATQLKEYLGVADPDLLNHIVNLLEARTAPRDIAQQLQPVFGEDANAFIGKLWSQLLREQLSV